MVKKSPASKPFGSWSKKGSNRARLRTRPAGSRGSPFAEMPPRSAVGSCSSSPELRRGAVPDGLSGSSTDVRVEQVRYDFNKTWQAAGSRFGPWKSLGPYLSTLSGFRVEFSLCCVRTAVEVYLRRTWDLPLNPWVDERRPLENVFRLFVTVKLAPGRRGRAGPRKFRNHPGCDEQK